MISLFVGCPFTTACMNGRIVIESFKTPAAPATATVIEKKSEFIANIAPVTSEDEAVAFLGSIRAAHRTARHNVYAYTLQQDARARYSDDGEPAKTAGLPVLSCIQHGGLSNCIIVVTRYFGGVLLGTGGLVRAYTAAANAAIQAATLATVRPVCTLVLTLPYSAFEQAMRLVEHAGARLDSDPVFSHQVTLSASLPAEDSEVLFIQLRELLRGEAGLERSETRLDFF